MRKILLVDTSNLARRNYHAQDLKTTTGIQTGLIYGTINSIFSIQKDHGYDKILNVWDLQGCSAFRKALWPLYKANRIADPAYAESRLLLEQLLTALGAYQVSKEGVEADDVIGYLTTHTYANDMVYILSTDKDYYSLISERVVVVHPINGPVIPNAQGKVPIKDGVKTIWLRPDQVVGYKMLRGDTSDNISGAPGFGIGAAITYFEHNDSADQLIDGTANIGHLTNRAKDGLKAINTFLPVFKKLVTIQSELGAIPEPVRPTPNKGVVKSLFEMLEFREFEKMGEEVYRLIGGNEA